MSLSIEGILYCQSCGARNSEDHEYCRHCHQKLLVVSGPQALEDQETFDSHPEEHFSFDEHLLERISILEEVVRRTTETMRQALGTLYKLEQKILVNQTGVSTLRDLLEKKRLIAREEWSELWESRMDYQLLALEKRERFAEAKDRIGALYQGEDSASFGQWLDEAELSLLTLDVENAIRVLDQAHQHDPANYELAFFLGETFFNEGEGEIALSYLLEVLRAKPNHFEGLVLSGVICHEQNNTAQAEKLLRVAVAEYPEQFLPAFSLGAIYAAQGRLSEAMVLLERAVSSEAIPEALYLLGRCSYEMGKTGAAIRHLREAVLRDPAFEEAHHLLGLAYLDRRWFKKAQEALGEAQRLHPKTLRYYELVRLLRPEDPEAPEAAIAVDDESISEPALEFVREAESSLDAGELRQALTAYRQALAREPDNPTLLVAYAMICLELGRTQEVESVLDKAMGLELGERLETTACATLIEALRFQGHYREGNRVGQSLLQNADSDFTRTVACFEIAFNLAEVEEDLDDALGYARRAVELASEEVRPFSLAALGWVHFKRREFGQAVENLERSNELGPSRRTLTHLGIALLASGRRDEARRALIEARDLGEGAFGDAVIDVLKEGARRLHFPAVPLGGSRGGDTGGSLPAKPRHSISA